MALLALLLLVVLACLSLPRALAQAATPRTEAEADRQGFAWVARKGERQLLLLATVHAATAQVRSLPSDIDSWVHQAGAVAIEADVTRSEELQALVQRHGLYLPGEPDLWSRLDPPLRQRAQTVLRRLGAEPDSIARLKPWLLAVTLATAELQRAGFNPEAGSEKRLLDLARQARRPVWELEGTALQLQTFDSAPPAVQVQHLQLMLDSLEDGSANRDLTELTTAWVGRDAAAMTAIVERMHREAGKSEAHRFLAQELLLKRHPGLLDAIERHAAQQPTLLVAVGALHWFGPGSLIEGLRQRGWDISSR